jgi:hypothetical protein
LTVLSSHKYLKPIIIDFFCIVIPTKAPWRQVKIDFSSRLEPKILRSPWL